MSIFDFPSSECSCGQPFRISTNVHLEILIPLYRSAYLVDNLLPHLETIQSILKFQSKITFIVDGDVDGTYKKLKSLIQRRGMKAKVIKLSRNFGVGPALLAGMTQSDACNITAIGADLQEPIDLIPRMLNSILSEKSDIALGIRRTREDPWYSKIASDFYWFMYNKFVNNQVPKGGFDAFVLTKKAYKNLCAMTEMNTNITAQIDWMGFASTQVIFDRLARSEGKTSWRMRTKLKLFWDTFYSFSKLPAYLSVVCSILLFLSLRYGIKETTFAPRSVFAAMVSLTLVSSIVLTFVGYLQRILDNSKRRPIFIVDELEEI